VLIAAQIYPTYPLNLAQLVLDMVDIVAVDYPACQREEIQRQWYLLLGQRLQSLLQERGLDYDLIHALVDPHQPAMLAKISANLQDFFHRASLLQNLRTNGILQAIYATVNRASRLANQGTLPPDVLTPEGVIDPQQLQQPIEQELYQAVTQLLDQATATQRTGNYDGLIQGLQAIAPVLARFFDGPESVLVMDANPAVQRNRLHLLGLIRNSALVLADFSQIVKT
jgi:Glycyl-tRNA synthetase, beta subunit